MVVTGMVNIFLERLSLNICITRLVKLIEVKEDTSNAVCPIEDEITFKGGDYDWDQELQGYILASFYIGYVISHLPGGLLAERYGGSIVFQFGVLISTITAFLTPITIQTLGPYMLIALRIIMGFGQGVIFPCLSVLMANWIPNSERSIIGSIVMGGMLLGTVVSNTFSSIILNAFEWYWLFYMIGVIGILWLFFSIFLFYPNPEKHPYISEEEDKFLREELITIMSGKDKPPIPVKDILKSLPVWAMVLASVGNDWGLFVMMTNLPKYMNDVLQIPILKMGILSSLPFVSMFITAIIIGLITDILILKNYFSLTTLRRFNTAIGNILPGIFLVTVSYAGCNRILAVALLCLCMTTMAPSYSGMRLSSVDLSPTYAGTLMALSNGLGGLTGFIAPSAIGLLTPNTSISEWRVVFWLSFVILSSSTILFCICGSGDVQPWNNGPTKKKDEA